MPSFVKTLAGWLLAASVAIPWLGQPGTAATPPQGGPPGAAAPPSQTAGYAGEATCLTCHEERGKSYHRTVHGRTSNANSPVANRGCESCHGPGRAHVESGGATGTIKNLAPATPPSEIDAQCLQCHARGARAMWEGSQHEVVKLSCVRCHSIHGAKSDARLLSRDGQVETCAQCHRSQVQKLRRSSHMPIQESALECSACHNPHGTPGVKLLKAGATINDTCHGCHAEKRGPFLWEHEPVVESCTTCHDPHGSTNDRMLVAKEPFLCQRCHITAQHPSTTYDAYALANSTVANRMSGRSCAACHQNVHGSNAPSGKAFLR